jgi:hypothetical protein
MRRHDFDGSSGKMSGCPAVSLSFELTMDYRAAQFGGRSLQVDGRRRWQHPSRVPDLRSHEFGGIRSDQAKRLKELEKENARRKRLLADAGLDKAILREEGRHRITIRDGVSELRNDLGMSGVIPLTDDIPNPGPWREAAQFVRKRGDVVFVGDLAEALRVNKAFASTLLAKAVLSGKVQNPGHQKGWIATEWAPFPLYALCPSPGFLLIKTGAVMCMALHSSSPSSIPLSAWRRHPAA